MGHQEAPYPDAEHPQALLNAEEQRLYSEPLQDNPAFYAISKRTHPELKSGQISFTPGAMISRSFTSTSANLNLRDRGGHVRVPRLCLLKGRHFGRIENILEVFSQTIPSPESRLAAALHPHNTQCWCCTAFTSCDAG